MRLHVDVALDFAEAQHAFESQAIKRRHETKHLFSKRVIDIQDDRRSLRSGMFVEIKCD